jgi:hypothetical protein
LQPHAGTADAAFSGERLRTVVSPVLSAIFAKCSRASDCAKVWTNACAAIARFKLIERGVFDVITLCFAGEPRCKLADLHNPPNLTPDAPCHLAVPAALLRLK